LTEEKKRFGELAERAWSRGIRVFSEFLPLDAQSELMSMRLPVPVFFEGGCLNAERRVAVFDGGSGGEAPICCLSVTPSKFAAPLTHRDCLGSLMALGIRRDVLGDIIVGEDRCFVFCLEQVADFIVSELTRVGRESVAVERCDPPESANTPPEQSGVIVSSERLDALISAVYRVPRSESKALCEEGRVFVNGRETLEASAAPSEGDVVSVRGRGRFIYDGIERETRKGRLRALVRVY
jgi:RNA-binding protein YlmH